MPKHVEKGRVKRKGAKGKVTTHSLETFFEPVLNTIKETRKAPAKGGRKR